MNYKINNRKLFLCLCYNFYVKIFCNLFSIEEDFIMGKKYQPETKEELKKLCENEEIYLGDIDVSKVTDMSGLFQDSKRKDFSGLETWDMSHVEDTSHMFSWAQSFNHNIGSWDMSNVKNTEFMFLYAESFNQYIGDWDMSNVEKMNHMFSNAKAFNQDIGNWKVFNVKNMESMFKGAESFNQNIAGWDISNVERMNEMFVDAKAFNQKLPNKWRVKAGFEIQELKEKIERHEEWLKDVYGERSWEERANFDFSKLPKEFANDPRRGDFSNMKFTDKNVDYHTFYCVDLSGAKFKGADFTQIPRRPSYVHLNYADLSDTKWCSGENSNLFGCELRYANLKGISEEEIGKFKNADNDLDSAVTDKGVCKSVLIPYHSSQSMPNDYWRANFYGLPNYANCHYSEYTNIPFGSMVVREENEKALREAGYQFDKKQPFLKFNEGQQISLSTGNGRKYVDASEFSKICCDAYLGKEKVEPKTVTNEDQIWCIKFNPTSRAPKHAIEFVSMEGKRDFDSLVVKQRIFVEKTEAMIGSNNVALNTDMIDRCEHFILSDQWNVGSSIPHMGDTYPTYFFDKEKGKVARGEVLVCPFVMNSHRNKSDFRIGIPYDLRTMNAMVDKLIEVQNEKRINYYKELSLANGIVPKDMNDEDLTKLAEENMILIKKPWQLTALYMDFDDKSKSDIEKLSSHIDCMNDKETLALQSDVAKLGFLYYNTAHIAKQMEFMANDIRKDKGVSNEMPVPTFGNKDVDKIMDLYNKVVSPRVIHIENSSKEREEKQEKQVDTKNQKNTNLHLICPESCIKLGKENIGIVLDFKNKVIAWTKRIDGKDSKIKEMVSTPKERAVATINEKNEQLTAKGFKPVDVNKMRTVILPKNAVWGLTVNGKHIDVCHDEKGNLINVANKNTARYHLSTQAILSASTYGRHLKDGKMVLNERRTSPVLTDDKKNKISLHKALSDLCLIKSNQKDTGKDGGKGSR